MQHLLKSIKNMVPLVMFILAATSALAAPGFINKGPNIVETTVALNTAGHYAGSFDTLILALQTEGELIDLLARPGQFTVFAPTDEAFESFFNETGLTAGQVLADQQLLEEVLSYHVKRARLGSKAIMNIPAIRMLNRGIIHVNGSSIIDQNERTASLVVTDVKTSNGIIHVIDNVVLP